MTETVHFPNGTSVLIEEEMGVVPRCGSCFEPLYDPQGWYAICMTADTMIGEKSVPVDRMLELVMEMVMLRATQHNHAAGHVQYEIEEEP